MTAETDPKPVRYLTTIMFSLVSVAAGIAAGLGAVFFRGLIALFHNAAFLGKLSLYYDASVHTPASPWGPFVILVPVLGAAGVAFLVKNYAPEAKGHGVPEVMDAIHYNRGRMRPIVAVVKSLASALSIGTGGSVGREGPIVQIGSSFGAALGEHLRLPTWQRITLVACGAAGGIAATFNTPVGGVLFAVELMLQEVSVRTLVPVTISTVTATYIGQLAFGPHPAFVIPAFETPYFHVTSPATLLAYAGLGVCTGVVAGLFIACLYGMESWFEERVGGSYYRQHILGMSCIGVMLYLLMTGFGHYYIEGVGYATIQDVLSGNRLSIYLLLFLFALKLLATCVTLGSGASGGVFSPALFMGATLGGAYGMAINLALPRLEINPAAFAVVGMAGVVGASTAAAITAIVMIFEMTLDYSVVVPMTLTVAISYGVRRAIVRDSIYTRKLALRGHPIPEALQANIHLLRGAATMMDTEIAFVPASQTLSEFRHSHRASDARWFLVEDGERILGLVPRESWPETDLQPGVQLGDIAVRNFCIVSDDVSLSRICSTMRKEKACVALVASHGLPVAGREIRGVITKSRIADVLAESIDAFEEG